MINLYQIFITCRWRFYPWHWSCILQGRLYPGAWRLMSLQSPLG